ncbi:MAG: hypothetical protein OHK0013_47830 [Sandaracinaceae bacterium]
MLAMRAEAVEGPSKVGVRGHADRATRRNDAEQDARSVRALGAAGEERLEPELREGLSALVLRANGWWDTYWRAAA